MGLFEDGNDRLRLVHAEDAPVRRLTGEELLRQGARVLAHHLNRHLPELDREDPLYDEIVAEASRFGVLGGLRSHRTPSESRS